MRSFLTKTLSYIHAYRYSIITAGAGAITILLLLTVFASVHSFNTETHIVKTPSGDYSINESDFGVESETPVARITFENIPEASFVPSPLGKTLRINLFTMEVKQYENGTLVDTKKLVAKPRIGSVWETPGGSYVISNKEEDYYSDKAGAWFPYSMHLFGNYFIHGTPHDAKGRTLNASFSNGCLRLSNDDAEEIFNWADVETNVSIYSDSKLKPASLSTDSVYIAEDGSVKPKVSAEAYVVADIDTGEIILQKNKDIAFPIASVSKLMTGTVSLDTLNQFDYAKVSKQAVSTYGVSGLVPGEEIELSNLLNPLFLASSNDAAEVIAEHLGRDEFLRKMNEKAKSLGMDNTNYEDPSGLSPNNKSSAADLFRLAQYITKEKPVLWDITKRKTYSAQGHAWRSINQFVNDRDLIGSKSGFTGEAKQTNVGVWSLPLSEVSKRRIAIVILRSNDRFNDTKNILSYLKTRVVYGRSGNFQIVSPKDKTHEITMRFVGDIMLDRGVKYSVTKNFSGDYSRLFENLGSYRDVDVFFANLEGPVSDKGTDMRNLYSFRMNPKVIPVLKDAGLDIVSFANNHVGDWQIGAFTDTLARLREAGIKYTGAGMTSGESEEPTVIDVKGMRIGFLGFTDVGPNWLEATTTTPGVNLLSNPRFDDIVKNAATKVDFLVISIHWGVEYTPHTDRQASFAHRAIDDGARLVIGHHPHVIQDVETYKGGLIAYSLGNFIFDQGFSADTMKGMTFQVTLDADDKIIKRYDTFITTLDTNFVPSIPIAQKEG